MVSVSCLFHRTKFQQTRSINKKTYGALVAGIVDSKIDNVRIRAKYNTRFFLEARKTIMVVDDDESIRSILEISLELEGYNVVTATNGKEALKLLVKSESCQLILLDLMMPVMNGWEFVEEIEKLRIYSNIPIILVTASGDSATDINVHKIVCKPIPLIDLLKIIGESIALSA